MTRIHSTIHIHKPIDSLYDFVTTAGNWPRWHPASLAVRGAVDHSGQVGDEIIEDFRVAGRKGQVTWTVRERDAPGRWVIEGRVHGGGGGTITYTLTAADGGTTFAREFAYTIHSRFWALLDGLLIRPRIQAESNEALNRLKQVLESS